MRLIPNDISITEQFAIKYRLTKSINAWAESRFQINDDPSGRSAFIHTQSSLDTLEKECGIRCGYVHKTNTLTQFEVVDKKKYMMFVLKWL